MASSDALDQRASETVARVLSASRGRRPHDKPESHGVTRVAAGASLLVVLVTASLLALHPKTADMRPNEWGDLFAGCFATIGAIWLVAAYFLQRKELGLQRLDLRQQASATSEVARLTLLATVTSQMEHLSGSDEEKQLRMRELTKPGATYNRTDAGAGEVVIEADLSSKLPINLEAIALCHADESIELAPHSTFPINGTPMHYGYRVVRWDPDGGAVVWLPGDRGGDVSLRFFVRTVVHDLWVAEIRVPADAGKEASGPIFVAGSVRLTQFAEEAG